MEYTVKQVATMSGITIRTLRHYDEIGLLRPQKRSEAGYRLYHQEDLERLQQILFFRELDFPLSKIQEMLDLPQFDRQEALCLQIDYLENRAKRYANLAQLAKDTLERIGGEEMKEEQLFEGFDFEQMEQQQKKYQEEVESRWGNTKEYEQSKRKTKGYQKEDWQKINQLQEQQLHELIACFDLNLPVNHERVVAVCDWGRRLITEHFYDCTKEIFAGLGMMYISDERFKKFYDGKRDGLAQYYHDGIQYYCQQ